MTLECLCEKLIEQMNFRLTTVEIIRQQKGCSSSLRLQISALTCDECGAIPWDELQVYLLSIIIYIFKFSCISRVFIYISKFTFWKKKKFQKYHSLNTTFDI